MGRLRGLVAALLSLAMLGAPLFAAPASQLGIVVFADHAKLGTAAASVGSTVFDGDRLSTETAGSLQVRTGAARLLLASSSSATLLRDEATPAAKLLAGTATFSTASANAFTLHYGNAAIRANTDEPTIGQVSAIGPKELVVKSTRGSLAFTVEGETRIVAEGTAYHAILNPTPAEVAAALSHARKEAPPQEGGVQRAGEISRVIPTVNVGRGGQTIPASANFVVDWQDQINTQASARARVGLDDGSVLNVGSDSLMRVVKHDASAQQTDLELTYGKMRSRAQKIAKPGGKFEVRTGAGIAGVVGTDFYVDFLNDVMNVIVFEGQVRVCNLAGVCVLVNAGEMTSLRTNSEPTPPVPVPFSVMTSAAADTDDGVEAVPVASTTAPRPDDRNRNKGSSGPISAGSSKFVWYAVGVVAIVTAVGIHQALESPDRP
jgi:ferric-dicitrate binding protein FerR (iron transport regulator)